MSALLNMPPLVATAIALYTNGQEPVSKHLELVQANFDLHGPWTFCKANDLLVNDSAEEFAIQFMAYWNNTMYHLY